MKIFTATQIREADAYTIQHEPISSLQLMERAATACAQWLFRHFDARKPFYIFCGMGNNGGDGLAITRLLLNNGYKATACIVHHSNKASADHTANRQLLEQQYPQSIYDVAAVADLPTLPPKSIIIDAIFGTGLRSAIEGWMAGLIHQLNDLQTRHTLVAIDLPSGMLADASSAHMPVVHASITLSFEVYKLAFLLPENAARTGQVHILPIGLHPDYLTQTPTRFHVTDAHMMRTIYQPRQPFAHKGTYGHALLVAGSYGKMGAAVLSAKACLHAGVGLLTCHVPQCGYQIIQISAPSAMCVTDIQETYSSHFHESAPQTRGLQQYKTIGIGPGLGTATGTAKALEQLLEQYRQPMVLDADALNIISEYPFLLPRIPHGSLLTPHPKEFERIFGSSDNDFARLELLSRQAVSLQLYILLKGRFTAMACPDGAVYFNSTGNPGMATGGSGDVLTGILTSLLAQGYAPKAAILLGTYLHGLAGDIAAARMSQEAMTAESIIDCLGPAFLQL
ncbi:NAD(P)H-hydrate epimerase [Chitinophaga rupis]|uniref:Bifunctional NAD(P)H-hydrate repair enzyme n=1 Tax=Chitinophaga rupis TaxID=573321 RepID=A0A1H7XNB9_9BACT|nr:NAD(P)H-hydrate dehydratase [Chitinophaga rupis]SEM35143.1 NAD(P)H-hydrate epimerase [Chitinophaga rupis]